MPQVPPKPPEGTEILDAITVFPAGMDSGIDPQLLPRNQLAFLTNGTVRGSFMTHRPALANLTLAFANNTQQQQFQTGLWQGGCYAQPSNSPEALVCSISGMIWYIEIDGAVGNVTLITPIYTDLGFSVPGPNNPPTNPQVWMFQAEKWVIINDGASTPIFLDLDIKKARRSQVQNRTTLNNTIITNNAGVPSFVIPAVGANVTVIFQSATGLTNGQIVNVWGVGQFSVNNAAGDPTIILTNVNAIPVGGTVVCPATVTWTLTPSELPTGRMGAYWQGRIWISLTDGIQFLAGDIVGGPSGTLAANFVDAILKITENTFLAGGGNFRVPGTINRIQAIIPVATLDASLGQGPLAVLTNTTVFTVNATVNRLTWQSMQNPILTEALISNGALAQNSTIAVNGDTIFRAVDGIRSLILGRREFDTWGNVPISQEMARIINLDAINLLPYSSAIVFDNRMLMTVGPIATPNGVYHPGLMVMNFDALSTLRGKLPSVYDGLWKGINTLQLVTGYFAGLQRAFAFSFNSALNAIGVTEIMEDSPDILTAAQVTLPEIYDYGSSPIAMSAETPVFFKSPDAKVRPYLQLLDGEIAVDNVIGTVSFQVFYSSDQYPCWIPWFSWQICAQLLTTDPTMVQASPQFNPRMGLGIPDGAQCDPTTNRPYREGYEFQLKLNIVGHCRPREIRIRAVVKPQPKFQAPLCEVICPTS